MLFIFFRLFLLIKLRWAILPHIKQYALTKMKYFMDFAEGISKFDRKHIVEANP